MMQTKLDSCEPTPELATTDAVSNLENCTPLSATPEECQEWVSHMSSVADHIRDSRSPILPEFEIPKLTKDTYPAIEFFTLAEAAEITKCTTTALLQYGGKGLIKFCVGVPDKVRVQSVDIHTGLRNGLAGWKAQMLVLDPEYCAQIGRAEVVKSSMFKMAYAVDQHGQLRTYMSLGSDSSRSAWRTFFQGKPINIEMSAATLLVMAFDLKDFIDASVTPKAEYSISKAPKEKPQGFVDAMTRFLQEIAKRCKGKDIAFDKSEMPGTKSQLLEVAKKYNPSKFSLTEQTFDDYLHGLCQFKRGRPKSEGTNPYKVLFPEFFD